MTQTTTTNSNQSATPEELQYWAKLDKLDASAFAVTSQAEVQEVAKLMSAKSGAEKVKMKR